MNGKRNLFQIPWVAQNQSGSVIELGDDNLLLFCVKKHSMDNVTLATVLPSLVCETHLHGETKVENCRITKIAVHEIRVMG